jgi:phage gp29-like protein
VSHIIGEALKLERKAQDERDLAKTARRLGDIHNAVRRDMKAEAYEKAARELRSQAETLRALAGAL